jgi:polyferredoxin
MGKMGYEPGLIRYTTQNALEGNPTRVFRPRTLIYSAILGLMFVAFIFALTQRTPLSIDVIRDRNTLYRETNTGQIEAIYTLKVLNKSDQSQIIELDVSGLDGITLMTDPAVVRIEAGAIASIIASVRVPRESSTPGGHDIRFSARYANDPAVAVERQSRFIMPLQ